MTIFVVVNGHAKRTRSILSYSILHLTSRYLSQWVPKVFQQCLPRGHDSYIWCLVRTWLKCPTVILNIDTFSTNWYLLYFATFLYERKMKIFLRGCQHFIELLYLNNLPILSMIYARHWCKVKSKRPTCPSYLQDVAQSGIIAAYMLDVVLYSLKITL